jgi:hypothetical protein
MTLVFTTLLAITVGERVSPEAGRRLLFPLLAAGGGSVLYWRFSDDLRFYGLVQFYSMSALLLLLILFPPRYTGTAGTVAMLALYAVALALDRLDRRVFAITGTGGQFWKHLAAVAALFVYVSAMARRRRLKPRPSI